MHNTRAAIIFAAVTSSLSPTQSLLPVSKRNLISNWPDQTLSGIFFLLFPPQKTRLKWLMSGSSLTPFPANFCHTFWSPLLLVFCGGGKYLTLQYPVTSGDCILFNIHIPLLIGWSKMYGLIVGILLRTSVVFCRTFCTPAVIQSSKEENAANVDG